VDTFSLPAFETLFPFALDDFQAQAIAALNAGESVVVCAPTGSGKTLIGDYAIYRALSQGRRVFYTTPLKALSNQKLRDFRESFGQDQVGLLTGDISINRDAPILVMTTEIFRNMLYGTPVGEEGEALTGLDVVVLDECHYMNDRQRGTVWEESIIYCPPRIQLVALSATIANSDQLADWITLVHGPTRLIYSDWRPVPLQFHFCNVKGLFPLLNESQTKLNPRLQPKPGQGGRQRGGRNSGVKREDAPHLGFVLKNLQERQMLPAIYFIFSRRGCDQAVSAVSHMDLLTPPEAQLLRQKIDVFVAEHPEVGSSDYLMPLYRGIAAHHAGILPLWKGLVEELFQDGLIKVVFATETLAAGINMPARTTVISSLSKRTDSGHRLLNPSEFLQMAGRAGRRGKDLQGHVVTVQTRFEGPKEAAYLATTGADPLISQFAPSYGMVLNLLQTHSPEQARELVERSFGQYLSGRLLAPQRQAITDLNAELVEVNARLAQVNLADLNSYQKLRERQREEQRLLKTLQQQAEDQQQQRVSVAVIYAPPGTLLSLKRKPIQRQAETPDSGKPENVAASNVPPSNPSSLPAVLVQLVPGAGQFPYLACVGQDGRWHIANPEQVLELHGELNNAQRWLANLTLPADLTIKPGQSKQGDAQSAALADLIPTLELMVAPEVVTQQHRLAAVEAQMAGHPAHTWPNHAVLLRLQKRVGKIEAELSHRQEKLQAQSGQHWQEFLCLIEVLQHCGGLQDLLPTALGQTAASLRGDNELWLAWVLSSGLLDDLPPQQLAAACAALVTETARVDSFANYNVSIGVELALEKARPFRRQLFQLQRRWQIALPVWLELDLVGLVEQWALEVPWTDLCAETNLDEGDIVRLLRRTLDFLSQIPYAPHVSDALRQNAQRAKRLLDRPPVNEVI
jgi:superfamily II RNA helicase